MAVAVIVSAAYAFRTRDLPIPESPFGTSAELAKESQSELMQMVQISVSSDKKIMASPYMDAVAWGQGSLLDSKEIGHEVCLTPSSAQQIGQKQHPHSGETSCSPPDKNDSNKASHKDTVPCTCAGHRKCVNGSPSQGPETPDENVCWKWCNQAKCYCPDPCKS